MKKASIQSIYTIVLKEIRLERGQNQQNLAQALNVSPGTVTKFESGAISLSLDNFLKTSHLYGLSIKSIHDVAEKYAMWLNHFFGYEIFLEKIDKGEKNETDDFLNLANEFYSSDINKKIIERRLNSPGTLVSIIDFPVLLSERSFNKPKKDCLNIRNVFRYITNDSFRNGKIEKDFTSSYQVIFEEDERFKEVKEFFSKENFEKNQNNFLKKLNHNSFIKNE